ncbi:hypothetical protein [Haloarcula sp. JP-L23]|uniref:hypothetical protein n=1 Tax=Haloarcula sp. JP-L23 TaxID=2716717 RepID=UPI00140F2BEF|nr:hypothetical protein G9465_18495 [Haloarcula sp. JP-L23]
MSPAPSFTLDGETAAVFRDWLFETGVKNHAKPQIADPLAELAAAIDGELHDSTEYVAISASTTAFPPTDLSTGVDDAGSPPHQGSEHDTRPADTVSVNDADIDPGRLYDTFPDDAWHSPRDQHEGRDSTPSAHDQSSSTATPHTQGDRTRMPDRYLMSYTCSVCGSRQEVATSLQVCAFVDGCAACGAVDVRFTAIGIPSRISDT